MADIADFIGELRLPVSKLKKKSFFIFFSLRGGAVGVERFALRTLASTFTFLLLRIAASREFESRVRVRARDRKTRFCVVPNENRAIAYFRDGKGG